MYRWFIRISVILFMSFATTSRGLPASPDDEDETEVRELEKNYFFPLYDTETAAKDGYEEPKEFYEPPSQIKKMFQDGNIAVHIEELSTISLSNDEKSQNKEKRSKRDINWDTECNRQLISQRYYTTRESAINGAIILQKLASEPTPILLKDIVSDAIRLNLTSLLCIFNKDKLAVKFPYQDSENCFIECNDQMEAKVKPCPAGHIFNAENGQCHSLNVTSIEPQQVEAVTKAVNGPLNGVTGYMS